MAAPYDRSRKRGRTDSYSEYDLTYGASFSIPTSMSQWTENDLNKIGIGFAGIGTSPHEVLNISDNICKLENLPKEITETISYLNDTLDFEITTSDEGEIDLGTSFQQAVGIVNKLGKVYKDVKPVTESLFTKGTEVGWRIMEINGYVRAFIRRLIRLVNLKIKRETIVNEQYYTDMQTTFGGMCSLMVESGNAITQCITICGTSVTSQPDVRFMSQYLSEVEREKYQTVVSVAEVKHPPKDAVEVLPLRTRLTTESGEATSSQLGFSIHSFLNTKVLGEHGGELLANWTHSVAFSSISGVIICGTKVIITLLPLTGIEFDRIISGKQKDIKNIYYSEPFDILKKEERRILYEVFFRLAETRLTNLPQ